MPSVHQLCGAVYEIVKVHRPLILERALVTLVDLLEHPQEAFATLLIIQKADPVCKDFGGELSLLDMVQERGNDTLRAMLCGCWPSLPTSASTD